MAPASTSTKPKTRSGIPAPPSPQNKGSGPKKRRGTTKRAAPEESQPDDVFDSDALDDDDPPPKPRKRKQRSTRKKTIPPKRRKAAADTDASEDSDSLPHLQDGQEVVGRVVQAPKTGQVPPGQISQNTFDFLTKLKDPDCNDRQWFKLHEPVYRQAEQEWKAFVEEFTDLLTAVDTQVPPLPPKDTIHRIYRDIRFSNDETPYKTGLSASFSRSGRKGIFAGYFVAVKPGGESLVAAGSWCPARNELATIRSNLQRSSDRLRRVLSAPEFVKYFGEPRPRKDGGRQSIFGMEDELKVAPKGINKDHQDIDLLKCRSFAVVHRFSDREVLDPDFKDKLADMIRITRPFVHCLNDLMTIAGGDGENSAEDDEGPDEDSEED